MMLFQALDAPYVVAGFGVGLLVGMTGVGGGSLMTPILILVFGTQATTAVGTDLLYAALTKSAGSVVHARRHTVDWAIFRRLALGSVPATILTIAALYVMGVRGSSSPRFITIALGLTLILSAAAILAR